MTANQLRVEDYYNRKADNLGISRGDVVYIRHRIFILINMPGSVKNTQKDGGTKTFKLSCIHDYWFPFTMETSSGNGLIIRAHWKSVVPFCNNCWPWNENGVVRSGSNLLANVDSSPKSQREDRMEQQLEICTSVCPHYLWTLASKTPSQCKVWLEDRNEPTSLQPLFVSNFNLLSVFVSKFIGSGLCCLHNWRSWSFDLSCSPAEIWSLKLRIRWR